jgi:hypothetical protein
VMPSMPMDFATLQRIIRFNLEWRSLPPSTP